MSKCLIAVPILLAMTGCGDATPQQAEQTGQKESSLTEKTPTAQPELLHSQISSEEMTEQQVLEELLARLERLLKKACPEARFTLYDGWILAAFNDEMQCERAPYPGRGEMDWYFMAPKEDGFRLEVQFMNEDGTEEPRPPHYLEAPGRTGFTRRIPLEWKKPHVLIITLRWGRDFDPAITEKIEPAIAAYAKERK
jgi:hypothetical protein